MAEPAAGSHLQHNVHHFDQEAQKWDEKPHIREWTVKVAEAYDKAGVDFGPDAVVLDFGCGTGLLSELLAPKVKQVIGLDASSKMVDTYNAKAAAKGISNMTAVCLDVTDGTLPSTADAATIHMTLHHIEDVHKVLNGLSKLLKPRTGRLLVTDLYKHGHSKEFHGKNAHHTVAHRGGFDEAQLREFVADAGCEVESFNSQAVLFLRDVEQDDGSKVQEEFEIFLLVAKKRS